MTDSLFDRLKTMPKEELRGYLLTTNAIDWVASIAGISAIFFTLVYTSLTAICVTLIILYVFGETSVNMGALKTHIKLLIETKTKDK
jgi:uncharacterized membrane protein YdbT with pleckstrin-like domain